MPQHGATVVTTSSDTCFVFAVIYVLMYHLTLQGTVVFNSNGSRAANTIRVQQYRVSGKKLPNKHQHACMLTFEFILWQVMEL